MRKYEILVLLRPNLKADVKSKTIDKAEKLIGGKIVKKEEWGLKKLAYPIKKEVEADYILYYVETEGENVIEYRKMVNISKEIMRTLILVHEKDFPFNRKTTKGMKLRERKPRNFKKGPGKKPAQKIEEKEVEVKSSDNTTTDLTSMTLANLKSIAKEKGLKGYSTLKKDDLINLIEKES